MINDKEFDKFVEEQTREYIKDGLNHLKEEHRNIFKMMYGRNNGYRSVEDTLDMSIDDIVDVIPKTLLKTAADQVRRTINKLN